jgi:hypothetical protein
MSRLHGNLVGSLVVAAVLALPTLALAAPVGIWVDVHYANRLIDPPHTKTYQFELPSLDKAAVLCGSETNLMRLVAHVQKRDTFLQHESIFSAECVMDRSGNIKTTATLVGSK